MSTMKEKIEEARAAINNIRRNKKFKKANKERIKDVELQNDLAVCRGKLEVCKNDFNRTIKKEARSIAEGKRIGADTTIQEMTLWDAAVGYMLVKDAIYQLKTIATFDSVNHAYDMLGAAIDQITERKYKADKIPKIFSRRERNMYGYVTSSTAVKNKEEILDVIFETLKQTGDIEACLQSAGDSIQQGTGEDARSNQWDEVLGSTKDVSLNDRIDEGLNDFETLHGSTSRKE